MFQQLAEDQREGRQTGSQYRSCPQELHRSADDDADKEPYHLVDPYSKWATAKLYTTKAPITAAEPLDDRVLPFFESQEMDIIRMLTDRGTEYCGKLETHDYGLYLAVNSIEHTKSRARHLRAFPQGHIERVLSGCVPAQAVSFSGGTANRSGRLIVGV